MKVMPKKVYDVIELVYTRYSLGIIQLEGTNIKTLDVVKEVPMKVHRFPRISII